MASTSRVTAAVEFLKNQYVERYGVERRFFAGCFGIFGHGNVAGIGQALQQNPDFPYYLSRNEQAIVHRFFSNWSRNRLLQAGFSLLGPYLSSSSLGVNDICSEGGSYKDS